jgi:hypothetical protein
VICCCCWVPQAPEPLKPASSAQRECILSSAEAVQVRREREREREREELPHGSWCHPTAGCHLAGRDNPPVQTPSQGGQTHTHLPAPTGRLAQVGRLGIPTRVHAALVHGDGVRCRPPVHGVLVLVLLLARALALDERVASARRPRRVHHRRLGVGRLHPSALLHGRRAERDVLRWHGDLRVVHTSSWSAHATRSRVSAPASPPPAAQTEGTAAQGCSGTLPCSGPRAAIGPARPPPGATAYLLVLLHPRRASPSGCTHLYARPPLHSPRGGWATARWLRCKSLNVRGARSEKREMRISSSHQLPLDCLTKLAVAFLGVSWIFLSFQVLVIQACTVELLTN